MTAENAITAIKKLIDAEILITEQANRGRGISKKAKSLETRAVQGMFRGLTGGKPTADQLSAMTSVH